MSDLKKYIEIRKKKYPEFAESYDSGYKEFKIGSLIVYSFDLAFKLAPASVTPGPFSEIE